ncbi:3-oxoacyl-[acyl-carrier-protein] reductase FabG-like [Manduca sexta]|uniref:Uncharacterized protein n=1 Tax=Manduca sexta TaxID=7130 RepID=A0A922CA05_MANSE|nr:3-oxoacyl-[acyl-carrier-protein] reductase FabG-like [Manduca sexta]KAG6440780.1 hypothetical protein O3G_MSEX001476 [Manduca sexta]
MSFENKVVIVTGAGGGIGAATTKAFAQEGAHIVMVDINEKNLKKVGNEISQYNKNYLLIKGNVSVDEDAKMIINKTIETFKKLDILVNNAGSVKLGNILSGNSVKAFDVMINNNLRSVVLMTSVAAPHLIKTKGNIVNVSSITAAKNPTVSHLMPYSVSKIGVEHFTRGAALELGPSGVRVNAVSPGPVKTNIIGIMDAAKLFLADVNIGQSPMGKLCKTEEIADLILFVASDKAKSITGSVYICDNGVLLK